jgi:hypothetical protein
MNKALLAARLAALTLSLASGSTLAADPLQPYPVKGQVIQRLNAFDNPEGSIFSADGRFVFVSNSAELGMPDKGFHWTHKGGYISKLAVQPDGTYMDSSSFASIPFFGIRYDCSRISGLSLRHRFCDARP